MPSHPPKLPDGLKKIDIKGYEISYFEQGRGAPLVLIHGSLSDYRVWKGQMAPFSLICRTIAVSLRHCYPEVWDGEGPAFSLQQHLADLAAFIKALDLGPVHLAGHSRGGDLALILGVEYPDLVQSLVLADPAPLSSMLSEIPEAARALENRNTIVTEALAAMRRGDLDRGLEIFTDAVSRAGAWKGLSKAARQIRRDNAWSLKSLVADGQYHLSPGDVEKTDLPVLLLTGDQSPEIYGFMHKALESCLKNHIKRLIPNASHGMQQDNAPDFNRAVTDFLSGQRI